MILIDTNSIPASSTGTVTTASAGTYTYYPPDYGKKTQLSKMIWEIESEKRLKLILTKLKEDKLTVDEAIQIIQGDRAIDING